MPGDERPQTSPPSPNQASGRPLEAHALSPIQPNPPDSPAPATDSPEAPKFDFERAARDILALQDAHSYTSSPETAEYVRKLVSAAAPRLAFARAHATSALTDHHLATAAVLLATGMLPEDVAVVVGCAVTTLYRYRRRDPDFRAAWDAALESSAAPIVARMAHIAMTGPAESTATMRAAEIALRRLDATYRNATTPGQARLEMRRTAPDGNQYNITVHGGAPLPD